MIPLSCSTFWLAEHVPPSGTFLHPVREVLLHKRTPFQELMIVETVAAGRALVLDGVLQSTEYDERVYHEALVHVAASLHGGPSEVLILGGGEGATLREVLSWRTVRRATMVDLDEEVVAACRKHLRALHEGAFEDPRADVVFADAAQYLAHATDRYDLVVSDLIDPALSGPAAHLYSREFFHGIRRVLKPGGVAVVQSGPIGLRTDEVETFASIARICREVFANCRPFAVPVPTYGCSLAFLLAGAGPFATRECHEDLSLALSGGVDRALQTLDAETILGLLSSPLYLRRAFARGGAPDEQPLFP